MAKYLLDKGKTVVGTLIVDRVGIPKWMKDIKGCAFPSTLYARNEELKAMPLLVCCEEIKGCEERHGSQYDAQISLHNEI